MKTNDASGIVFDTKSGISEEEQREILAKIDNIAEKNRLSLLESGQGEGKNKHHRFKAKKSGGVFPIVVNIAAIAALAGGLSVLSSMQWKTDARVRTGAKVYNSVERALIERIRKETHNEAAANADSELERLNREQYLAAAVEDQLGALFANLNRQITDNNLDEAGATIKSMLEFINTPAFQSLRSIQARKGLYTQAINSFETMIGETRKYQAALNSDNPGTNPLSDFQARIARLEQELKEKDKSIEALSSQGSGASRRLNELQKANSSLQTENRQLERTNNTLQTRNTQLTADLQRQNQTAINLQQSVNNLQQSVNTLQQSERDLQTENAKLTQTASERENTIKARDNTIANRNEVISRIRSEVELDREYDDIPPSEIKSRITRIQNALRSVQ